MHKAEAVQLSDPGYFSDHLGFPHDVAMSGKEQPLRYRGCQNNVPIEDCFSATNPYAAILFSEYYYDKRYNDPQIASRESDQFRWECQWLPPLDRWTDGETCADEHAGFDSTNGAHAGFIDDFNEHGHAINMSSTNYTNVACGEYITGSGGVWSVQNFE